MAEMIATLSDACEREFGFLATTCTPMLTGALFKIAKIWKQPKCALVDEWIKRCGVHIYNGIPLSQKKVWNLTICFKKNISMFVILCYSSYRKLNDINYDINYGY